MKKLLTPCAVCVAAMAMQANATIVYSNDFDGETTGVVAEGGSVLSAGGTGSLALSTAGTSDPVNTFAEVITSESDYSQNASGKSLRMYNESTLGEIQLRFTLASGAVGDGEHFLIGFDYYSPSANEGNLVNMQVQDGTSKASNTSFFDDGGNFLNHDGSGNIAEYNSMAGDTWYHFEGRFYPNGANADVGAMTADEFGGSTVVDISKGIQNNKTTYNSVLWSWNIGNTSKGSEFYLDNLTVSVIPEPATLGLISAFGAGILFVRRRFML